MSFKRKKRNLSRQSQALGNPKLFKDEIGIFNQDSNSIDTVLLKNLVVETQKIEAQVRRENHANY